MPSSDENKKKVPLSKKNLKSGKDVAKPTSIIASSSQKNEFQYRWVAIGSGSYNRVWRSTTEEQLVADSSYAGPWVLKYPTASIKDMDSNEMNKKERGIRLWNEINKNLPIAGLYKKGWVAPYIERARQATDDEIASKLIEIYHNTRRIILDAGISGNFLTVTSTGEVVLVDVDLALRRRNSQASLNFAKTLDVRFASYWADSSLRKSMAQTMNVTQNLLFFEDNLEPEVIDQLDAKNLITLQNIKVLTWLRENNRPLNADLFYKIASLTQIELEINDAVLDALSKEFTSKSNSLVYGNTYGFFSASPDAEDTMEEGKLSQKLKPGKN